MIENESRELMNENGERETHSYILLKFYCGELEKIKPDKLNEDLKKLYRLLYKIDDDIKTPIYDIDKFQETIFNIYTIVNKYNKNDKSYYDYESELRIMLAIINYKLSNHLHELYATLAIFMYKNINLPKELIKLVYEHILPIHEYKNIMLYKYEKEKISNLRVDNNEALKITMPKHLTEDDDYLNERLLNKKYKLIQVQSDNYKTDESIINLLVETCMIIIGINATHSDLSYNQFTVSNLNKLKLETHDKFMKSEDKINFVIDFGITNVGYNIQFVLQYIIFKSFDSTSNYNGFFRHLVLYLNKAKQHIKDNEHTKYILNPIVELIAHLFRTLENINFNKKYLIKDIESNFTTTGSFIRPYITNYINSGHYSNICNVCNTKPDNIDNHIHDCMINMINY